MCSPLRAEMGDAKAKTKAIKTAVPIRKSGGGGGARITWVGADGAEMDSKTAVTTHATDKMKKVSWYKDEKYSHIMANRAEGEKHNAEYMGNGPWTRKAADKDGETTDNNEIGLDAARKLEDTDTDANTDTDENTDG